MITDADIKKMKTVFATKKELKALDSKMDKGFAEIVNFIGEVKNEIMKELNDFRLEVREINKNSRLILDNHEARINNLEYTCK
jgi:hypothetical protein